MQVLTHTGGNGSKRQRDAIHLWGGDTIVRRTRTVHLPRLSVYIKIFIQTNIHTHTRAHKDNGQK